MGRTGDCWGGLLREGEVMECGKGGAGPGSRSTAWMLCEVLHKGVDGTMLIC